MASPTALAAHQTGQQPSAPAIGHQADLAERLDEAGAALGHHQIAAQGEVRSCARRHAIHGRDNRHGHGPHPGCQGAIKTLDNGTHIEAVRLLARSHQGRVSQILACAKAAAGSCNHERANGRVGSGGIQGRH